MKDGIDYINIYSRGETELGRMLSNFYEFQIETDDGEFMSVEGYWHWLNISPSCRFREELRFLSGFKALDYGRKLIKDYENRCDEKLFKSKITKAIKYKFEMNLHLLTDENKNLPFVHIVNGIDVTTKYWWFVKTITDIRKELLFLMS